MLPCSSSTTADTFRLEGAVAGRFKGLSAIRGGGRPVFWGALCGRVQRLTGVACRFFGVTVVNASLCAAAPAGTAGPEAATLSRHP